MQPTFEFLRDHSHAILTDLEAFVTRESPSDDKSLLDAFAEFLAAYARRSGGRPEIVPTVDRGNHVVVRWGDSQPMVLLVGHYDTVWPEGTLERMPFSVTDGWAWGPGAFDMKCGLVQGFWALRALQAVGARPSVTFVCNSDEELGSASSRALIDEQARRAKAVFVLEPSYDGRLKTARKGVARFEVQVTGIAAHAGLAPEDGASAVAELCRAVCDLQEAAARDPSTSLNVGVIRGGTRANVVAEDARAEIDVRTASLSEARRITRSFEELAPRDPRTRIVVTGGSICPPMERTPDIAQLFDHARDIANGLGFELQEASVGGGSDGSHCAALGVPVLDGLGAVGAGAHAKDERVEVASIPLRAALLAQLIQAAVRSDEACA